MATGWQMVENKWYYLLPNGVMATGHQTVDGKDYYLNPDGSMMEGGLTPDRHMEDKKRVQVR